MQTTWAGEPAGDIDGPWRHRYAVVNGVRLHYVEAGEAEAGAAAAGEGGGRRPTVILLHGFPEFWYGWRHQIPALAAAGFHVVAPDMRGYNLSDKPPRVSDYRAEVLAADVLALTRHVGGGRPVHLAGHDWGGVVAWFAAMRDAAAGATSEPVIDRLAILNAPHPAAYFREVRRPGQFVRSWYALSFQIPWLPEAAIRLNDFALLRNLFRRDAARPVGFTPEDVERYVRAFARPRALTSAINYYRAAFRRRPGQALRDVRPIERPTLLIWGERDRYLVPELTQGLEPWVRNLCVERLPGVSHWVQHDEPERVNGSVVRFLQD